MSQISIARDPDEAEDLISWWQGEEHLEEETQVTVGVNEIAVFFDEEVVAQLGPGRHLLNAANQPALADYLTSDDPPEIEVAFVTAKDFELYFDDKAGTLSDSECGASFDAYLECETFFMDVLDPGKVIAMVDELDEEGAFEEFVADVVFKNAAETLALTKPRLRDILAGKATLEPSKIETLSNAKLVEAGVRVRIPEPIIVDVDDDDREDLEKLLPR